MPRLIDADELLAHLFSKQDEKMDVAMEIARFTTIDPESLRPHGRWIEMVESIEDGHTGEYYEEIYYNCINCDYATGDKTPYCPNCGAKMDLEERDDEQRGEV